MTNNNAHNKSNSLNNSARAVNKIKLNMYGGVLRGNIIEKPPDVIVPTETCLENSLMFTCPENSQYIPVI